MGQFVGEYKFGVEEITKYDSQEYNSAEQWNHM